MQSHIWWNQIIDKSQGNVSEILSRWFSYMSCNGSWQGSDNKSHINSIRWRMTSSNHICPLSKVPFSPYLSALAFVCVCVCVCVCLCLIAEDNRVFVNVWKRNTWACVCVCVCVFIAKAWSNSSVTSHLKHVSKGPAYPSPLLLKNVTDLMATSFH